MQNGERATAERILSVTSALESGDHIVAYDLAAEGARQFPEVKRLSYLAVLAMARLGATEQAIREYRERRVDEHGDEDSGALWARLLKDKAISAPVDQRPSLFARAAAAYEDMYARTQGSYPGINAASLHMLAGDHRKARSIAEKVFAEDSASMEEPSALASYYRSATLAEARLILDGTLGPDLAALLPLAGRNYAALTSTRRQLARICAALDIPYDKLDQLRPPEVIHYCGHLVGRDRQTSRFPGDAEDDVVQMIEDSLSSSPAFAGYGSLGSGSDILFAEALLAHGAELHVHLPFGVEEFLETSVSPAGEGWVKRFRVALQSATSVTMATNDAFLGDGAMFNYASQLAMGRAILRAANVDTSLRQIAVWNGQPSVHVAGTAVDIDRWQRSGNPCEIIAVPAPSKPPTISVQEAPMSSEAGEQKDDLAGSVHRKIRSILFGDFSGFSVLRDSERLVFQNIVLERLAVALAKAGDNLLYKNSWGDAVMAVFVDAKSATNCALEMQASVSAYFEESIPLPAHLGFRIGGHFGPVFFGRDPIRDEPAYYGAQLTRAARLEPVTPPGQFFVTEPFAAALALENADEFRCNYVGRHPGAKGFEPLQMYRVTAA